MDPLILNIFSLFGPTTKYIYIYIYIYIEREREVRNDVLKHLRTEKWKRKVGGVGDGESYDEEWRGENKEGIYLGSCVAS